VCFQGHPSVAQEYAKAKAVVIAAVTQADYTAAPDDQYFVAGTTYQLKIEKIFRGDVASQAGVFSENSSGRFSMQIGHEYLLFLSLEDRLYIVDNCGNSAALSRSGSVLKQVERLSASHPASVRPQEAKPAVPKNP
jgi:hypothetical protein